MANRYWVGGTGTWDLVNTANWSATSGGASGASVPVAADAVFFNASSGGGTATLAQDVTHTIIGLTGFTGTLDFNSKTISLSGSNTTVVNAGAATLAGTPHFILTYAGGTGTRTLDGSQTEASAASFTILAGSDVVNAPARARNLTFQNTFTGSLGTAGSTIYGDITLSTSMSVSASATYWSLGGLSGTINVTTNGVTFDRNLFVGGGSGSVVAIRFQDNFTQGSTRAFTTWNGTIDGNNKNISIGSFSMLAGTKTLTLGSGTWSVAGNWDANTNVTNLTVSASTGTISMTSASTKTFSGGAKTWPTLNQGGAGALTIQQSNTFTNITNTVQPATITLTSGTTQTVTDFDVSGTSGNLITLNASTPGSRATLTDSGGVNSVSFVDIKDIAATGYGEWQAYTSNGNVDSGNNVGWVFAAPPAFVASEYPPELRSFTEKRRF
jgi:hypothetical protein